MLLCNERGHLITDGATPAQLFLEIMPENLKFSTEQHGPAFAEGTFCKKQRVVYISSTRYSLGKWGEWMGLDFCSHAQNI